ncbi:MAG: oxygen-independent coproporphyrinogen III oxidase [Candidatus Methylopumilus sp.]|jgi:oxygen-independent coproporphyrinogen-3 oxidase|nr:oxygen-independent coproporphyrinogen III oxidase [Betaproteobacteria bacterium]
MDTDVKKNRDQKLGLTPITTSLLQKFDVNGPRYTSYPTADRFVEAFTENAYKEALEQRRLHPINQPLSIYVHIPFCESLCFYCACNKIVTKHHERSREYLDYLKKEIDLHLDYLGQKQVVSQLHLGGGSPTFFSDEEIKELFNKLKEVFVFSSQGEYSIEVDPRTVDSKRLKRLKEIGFNRLSFGVQDFNPDVQKAVHRVQPFDQVVSLMNDAHEDGYESINMDLIYGLPLQTPETFNETLDQVISLKPDRIALYAYAHLPQRFKPQRRIHEDDIPPAKNKITMLSLAIEKFLENGYIYVGMDHFALPTDSLAIAKRQGRLHRNFQGYSTQPDCDIIALGVSAIGRVGANYNQNAKELEDYYDHLNHRRFPIIKGLALSKDDIVRRAVIMEIMCQGRLDYQSIELAYLINFKEYFSSEMNLLRNFQEKDFIDLDDSGIQVTDTGWFFVRAIAMIFDRYLQLDQNRTRFSKIL